MQSWPIRTAVLAVSTTMALLGVACKQTPKPEETAQQQPAPAPAPKPSVPNIKVTPPVQAKAKTPKPGPGATKEKPADTFGKGKASIPVKTHPRDRSFWAEQLDVTGSGNPDLVQEAWDSHSKILYVSNDRTFTCGNGQSASGSTLMAIYGKGNLRKRPDGSGWWVSELNPGDCGVPVGGLYGCHFDAAGTNSDCGSATIVPEADEVEIVPLPDSGSAGANGPAPGAAGATGNGSGANNSNPGASTGAAPGQPTPQQ